MKASPPTPSSPTSSDASSNSSLFVKEDHPHDKTLTADDATGTMTTKTKASSSPFPSSNTSNTILWLLKLLLLDVPLLIVCLLWITTRTAQSLYHGPLTTLVESLQRIDSVDEHGYYPSYDNQLTYYGRQCGPDDITTTTASDLLVPPTATRAEAAHTMMEHGAVLIPNILTQDTASNLREYLESRHKIQSQLPWHEKFWEDNVSRLSLGLGTHDHPSVTQALEEVGNSKALQTVLEGIVGPDPAIVEVSTLTTMYNAYEQGIHTDSDFFGSSLLYSRSYLHSYTLFMALQDTTSRMGATTVCPGSHWCANEDFSEACVPSHFSRDEQPAFEASSNGKTGLDTGVLLQGDGMMFNQNVWHRGPTNKDPNFPNTNRVMFILTFVSRPRVDLGDVRIPGIGTYYYQRWNMWGHTFGDLKDAAKRMWQPLAALRAMGLYKLPGSQWGMSWWIHFARQLANREDFYADYELDDCIRYLRKHFLDAKYIPRGVSGWDEFLQKMVQQAVDMANDMHWMAVAVYIGIHVVLAVLAMVVRKISSSSSSSKNPSQPFSSSFSSWKSHFVVRLLGMHLMAGLVGYGMIFWFDHSLIGQRINSGYIWRKPFVAWPEDRNEESNDNPFDALQDTTLPERMDILVGSRLDAPYLASFNRVLDYHPGNKRWLREILPYFSGASQPSQQGGTNNDLLHALLQEPVQGFVPRFLQQDYATGYWSVMNSVEVHKFVNEQLLEQEQPLIQELYTVLKTILADSRFGLLRDSAMAKTHIAANVAHWQNVVLQRRNKEQQSKTKKQNTLVIPQTKDVTKGSSFFFKKTTTTTTTTQPHIVQVARSFVVSKPPATLQSSQRTNRILRGNHVIKNNKSSSSSVTTVLSVGDYVLADGVKSKILHIYNSELCHAEDVLGGGRFDTVSVDSLRPYRPFVQGDLVQVELGGDDFYEDDESYQDAIITLANPLGTYTVRLLDDDDDDDEEGDEGYVMTDQMTHRGIDEERVELSVAHAPPMFSIDQRIWGNFQGRGEWFLGRISNKYRDDQKDGILYDLMFDDGDGEEGVPVHRIRKA